MSKVNVSASHIAALKPLEVVKDDCVRQRFIDLASTLWGEESAEATYEREAIYFNRLINDSPKLKLCTPVSIFIAFIDVAVCGLSVEPGVRAQAYLQPRGYKSGKDSNGRDVYEQRCTLTISGYGELVQRTRAGQIRHADNPVIVFDGDGFSFTDHNGTKTVDYTLNINHNSQRPIACFMKITRADGSIDYSVMLEEGWRRLAGYSGKANRSWDSKQGCYVERPNDLYMSGEGGSIDQGFLIAKCIKHAFSTYPKVRIGRGTIYEADQPKPREDEDYYGMEGEQPQQQEESFAQPQDTSAGVTIDPSQSEDSDDGTF
jgi:hypothetical protein